MVACPTLPNAASGALADLLANHVDVAKAYDTCKGRHGRLADAVRRHQGAQ